MIPFHEQRSSIPGVSDAIAKSTRAAMGRHCGSVKNTWQFWTLRPGMWGLRPAAPQGKRGEMNGRGRHAHHGLELAGETTRIAESELVGRLDHRHALVEELEREFHALAPHPHGRRLIDGPVETPRQRLVVDAERLRGRAAATGCSCRSRGAAAPGPADFRGADRTEDLSGMPRTIHPGVPGISTASRAVDRMSIRPIQLIACPKPPAASRRGR